MYNFSIDNFSSGLMPGCPEVHCICELGTLDLLALFLMNVIAWEFMKFMWNKLKKDKKQ